MVRPTDCLLSTAHANASRISRHRPLKHHLIDRPRIAAELAAVALEDAGSLRRANRCLDRAGIARSQAAGDVRRPRGRRCSPVARACMWEELRADGEILLSFATLTTDAKVPLSLIQERRRAGRSGGDVAALLRPRPADQLRVSPVDRKVNSVHNDGSELLEPPGVPAAEPLLL